MSAETEPGGTTIDLKSFLGEKPFRLTRREMFAMMGAALAAAGLKESVSAAPYSHEQYRALAADTGPTAKIVIANGEDLDELDPHYFKSVPAYTAVANLYDNLFAYDYTLQADGGLFPKTDANGDWVLLPWLLESWTVSTDQKTLTFKLRTDVVFSDGTPLSAADVKATWDRGLSDTSAYSKTVFNLMTVMTPDQIAQPDASTIVVTLQQPTIFALKMIAVNVVSIMSAKAIQAHATAADPTAHDYFHANPLGSTAYVLSKWTPGVEWDLDVNPNYWNKSALKNGGVVNRTVPSPQDRLSLLKNGDVDIAFELLPKDLADLKTDPNINLYDFQVPWPNYLGMNNKIAPFNNVDVRRAISNAIPYDTIIDKVMYGFAQRCKSPVAAGMPTSDFSTWNYDGGPDKCKSILDGLSIKNLSFDLSIRIGIPEHEQIATWIQASLQQAGVTLNIDKLTDSDYLSKFNAGGMQTWIGDWYSWVNDPIYHMYFNFYSTNTATNGVGYSNPQVDTLLKNALYETDQTKRDDMSKQAQAIIISEAPWGLLYQVDWLVAARKNITGFQWNTDTACRYWMVSKS